MDPQTKKKIIAEKSSTAHRTIEEAFKDSLKRLFSKDKTAKKAIK